MTKYKKLAKDDRKSTKTPYRPPKLIVYGDVREITKNVGGTVGANDGGGGKDKTGFA